MALLAHRWSSRNLTRLELVTALLVLALLIGIFVHRGLRIFAEAEESAFQTTVMNLNSALRLLFFDRLTSGRLGEVAAWQGANPLRLLAGEGTMLETTTLSRFPELGRFEAVAAGLMDRYQGEFDSVVPSGVTAGDWYFDRTNSVLVYLVRNDEFFRSALPGPARVRLRLEVRFDDLDGDGQYNQASDRPVGIVLGPVEPFHWIRGTANP